MLRFSEHFNDPAKWPRPSNQDWFTRVILVTAQIHAAGEYNANIPKDMEHRSRRQFPRDSIRFVSWSRVHRLSVKIRETCRMWICEFSGVCRSCDALIRWYYCSCVTWNVFKFYQLSYGARSSWLCRSNLMSIWKCIQKL